MLAQDVSEQPALILKSACCHFGTFGNLAIGEAEADGLETVKVAWQGSSTILHPGYHTTCYGIKLIVLFLLMF